MGTVSDRVSLGEGAGRNRKWLKLPISDEAEDWAGEGRHFLEVT